jgi:hypothetical protein
MVWGVGFIIIKWEKHTGGILGTEGYQAWRVLHSDCLVLRLKNAVPELCKWKVI